MPNEGLNTGYLSQVVPTCIFNNYGFDLQLQLKAMCRSLFKTSELEQAVTTNSPPAEEEVTAVRNWTWSPRRVSHTYRQSYRTMSTTGTPLLMLLPTCTSTVRSYGIFINAYETCILNLKFKRIYSVVVQI